MLLQDMILDENPEMEKRQIFIARKKTKMDISRRDFLKGVLSLPFIASLDLSLLRSSPTPFTPYDSKVCLWHWKGNELTETSIESVIANIRAEMPNINALFVKTNDGEEWMGTYDTPNELAINDTSSIDGWVEALENNGMEFHAWCIPKGTNIDAETDLIIQVCTHPGVKSMILDVEPYDGYWAGEKEQIRPYMSRIRDGIGEDYHLGMLVDPRESQFESIYPGEWLPYVDSIHPQAFWQTFQRGMEDVIEEAYRVWGDKGLPVIPVFQTEANPVDMAQAVTIVAETYLAPGISWWRLGAIDSNAQVVIDQTASTIRKFYG